MEEDDRKKEKRKVKKQSKEKYNRQSEEKDDRQSEEKDDRQSEEKDGRKKEKRKAKKRGGKDKRKGKNDYNLDYDVDIIYQDPNAHHDQNEAEAEEHVKKGTWEDTLKNQNDRTKMTVV